MTTNKALAATGLKQRKTFEEVIDYIQNDKTKIKYPDRTAKFLRNSFELSQLDNAGMMLMEQQQFREMKEREKEHLLRQLVANTSKSITEARATHTDESDGSSSTPLYASPTEHQQSVYQTPGQPSTQQHSTSPVGVGSATQELLDAQNVSLDLSLEAQYAAFDDERYRATSASQPPQRFGVRQLIFGNYDEREQEMRDIQTARNAQVDMEEQLKREDREENRRLARQHLHDVYRSHHVASLMQPPSAASSSFDLSRELSGVITPPHNIPVPATPVTIHSSPNVSPVTIHSSPNVSPIPIQQSPPPKRQYTRATSYPARSVEAQGEVGIPKGKQVEAKPRGRPKKKAT